MSARWSGISLLLTMVFIQPVYAGDRQGTLDNGLSYIVRQSSRPVGEAEFRLVVKAGELDVTGEKSQGAMHLIEHMAFRNTKDYPDGSLVPFLRGKGFRFGLHMNGATRPGVTTYQLSLSHAKPQDLDDGLNVLFNMAQNVDFSSAAFAREKNVVAEEIRMHGDNPWVAVWENG
ncbi:MAG: insulinase family protein, partial [Iodobacter sp.]